jgi:hypothetical protein
VPPPAIPRDEDVDEEEMDNEESDKEESAQPEPDILPPSKRVRANTAGASYAMPRNAVHTTSTVSSNFEPADPLPWDAEDSDGFENGPYDLSSPKPDPSRKISEVYNRSGSVHAAFLR